MRVSTLIDGKVVETINELAEGVTFGGEAPDPEPFVEDARSYEDVCQRILAACHWYRKASLCPPGSVERHQMLEQAGRTDPAMALQRVAHSRQQFAALVSTIQAIGAASADLDRHLARIDGPAAGQPDELLMKLRLRLMEGVNLLRPFILAERENAASDPATNRVPWDEAKDGYVPLSAALSMLRDEADRLDVALPTASRVGALLDRTGNPVRHMKRDDSGGGRGNRRLLASDVLLHKAYLLGRRAAGAEDDEAGIAERIKAVRAKKDDR